MPGLYTAVTAGHTRHLYCFPVAEQIPPLPAAQQTPPQPPKVHLGRAAILGLVGAGVAFLAFLGPFFVPALGVDAIGVWQSILTSFGVALFSGALLLLFEPMLRKAITKSVTEDVKRDVREAVKADLDERLTPLSERINSAL